MATDGTVTDGPYPEAIAGLCGVEVPSHKEALEWAAKTARISQWPLTGELVHEVAVPSACAGQGRTVRDGHCCRHRVVLAR